MKALSDRVQQDPTILDTDLLEEMKTQNPENLYIVQLPETPDGVLRITPFNLQEFKQGIGDKQNKWKKKKRKEGEQGKREEKDNAKMK